MNQIYIAIGFLFVAAVGLTICIVIANRNERKRQDQAALLRAALENDRRENENNDRR